MCGDCDGPLVDGSGPGAPSATRDLRTATVEGLLPYVGQITNQRQVRRSAIGFVGYGGVQPGDRILVGVDNQYNPAVVEAVVRGLRECGGRVDVIETDIGPDREFDELDEIRAIIRKRSFLEEPRRWEGQRWIEEKAMRDGYDLLILGKGGGPPPADGQYRTPDRYESIPWLQPDHLASGANSFPLDLHMLINERTWAPISEHGRLGRVHLTDPEGTDVSWTLREEGWAPKAAFGRKIHWGHLHAHTTTPVPETTDAEGIVCGTTSHFSRPFPQIRLHVERGRVRRVEGGGAYGEAWQSILEETKDVRYPVFPDKGLFWLVEAAIGTNPKIRRLGDLSRLSSGGTEWERRRSGVLHLGFGTFWRDSGEQWAMERGITYGHLHVHQLFATMDVTTREGRKYRIIDHGRLTALDDPDVRKLASRYGDPDELLTEAWTAEVPGITAAGDVADYLADPARWVYGEGQTTSE